MAKIYPFSYMKDKVISTKDATLSVASSAVLYGLSVYTVLPLIKKQTGELAIFRPYDHYNRLVDSSQIIGIDDFKNQFTYEKFLSIIKEVVKANNISDKAFVRITFHVSEILPGTRSRRLETTLSIFIYEAENILKKDGVRIKISPWQRVSDKAIPPRAKVNGAYVNSVLGKQNAIDDGYDDCLFLNDKENVAELSAANAFIVKDGILYTPSVHDDILLGITRKTIIEYAKKEGIEVNERSMKKEDIFSADEVFACGTSASISSIKEIDGKTIGNNNLYPVTKSLQEYYKNLMDGTHKDSGQFLVNV